MSRRSRTHAEDAPELGFKFTPPSTWIHLTKDGKTLALVKSVAVAEAMRDRWAVFGLEVDVVIPKRRYAR